MASDPRIEQTGSQWQPARRPRWRWLVVFLVGLVLWIASIIVTALTANVNLIPTDVLLGSFLVPVTAVIWNFDRDVDSALSGERIFTTFVVGGVLGILAASILESSLLSPSPLIYFGVGFAALESSGYAFNALFTSHGISLGSLIATEALRGVLAPVGHGLWTAIVGGVLFHAASRGNRLRITAGVVGAYLLVSILHGLWDSMRGIAALLTALVSLASGQLSAQSGAPTAATP